MSILSCAVRISDWCEADGENKGAWTTLHFDNGGWGMYRASTFFHVLRPVNRRKKGAAPAAPAPLYSLTGEQAAKLREAAAKAPRGVYVPVCCGPVPGQLVDGGAAEFREERQSSGTRSATDSRPCEWSDLYLVPTARGLELLERASGKK